MDGLALLPGAGKLIQGGGLHATQKVGGAQSAFASTFEVIVPSGYDVGAHVHSEGEELFYILEGELDILAFEPLDRSPSDWRDWVGTTGQTFVHGGPGSLLYVPAGCPHAFANRSTGPATMFFQSSPTGHEDYFEELAALLSAGPPEPADIIALRTRFDIAQLTPFRDRLSCPPDAVLPDGVTRNEERDGDHRS